MQSTTTTEVQTFWQSLQPSAEAERPWLFAGNGPRAKAWSSKDIFAQANCLAAFLMTRGLQANDPVIIRMADNPQYLVLDLAIQFAGGKNVTLEPNATNPTLVKTAIRLSARFLFIEDSTDLGTTDSFEDMKSMLFGIILLNEEPTELAPEKLFTFERAVILGKTDWRENAEQFNDTKASRSPQDIYALVGTELSEISYKKFITDVAQAQKILTEKDHEAVWFCGSASSYWRRTMGYFGAMIPRPHTRSLPESDLSLPIKFKPTPDSIFVSPSLLEKLFDVIAKNIIGKEGVENPKMAGAIETARKRREALAQGKKPSLGIRTKYTLAQASIFGKVRKAVGTKCKTFYLDDGQLSEKVRQFFEDAGIELVGRK